MMTNFTLVLLVVFLQEIPFKPKEEFEVKLNYEFKQRPTADPNTVNLGHVQKTSGRNSTGVLPYLVLNIKMLALPDTRVRLSITNNLDERSFSKRVSLNSVLELDMGFTDDMIDRVEPHEYTLTFLDDNKKPVDRIVISVAEDGSFFVNDELRGKF